MLIDLLGVRGSTAAPGAPFVRFGGHTSCLALRSGEREAPDLLLDAGTGIGALGPGPFHGAVLLSHLHWDHVQGLPFAAALLHPGADVEIAVPVAPGVGPVEALLPMFSPPAFPVRPDELHPGWRFTAASEDRRFGGWTVRTADVRHKGGRTVGTRVERDNRSVVYLPDHDLAEPDPAAEALARGADLLVHDGQYLASEIERFRGFGHSTIERACAFADSAGVGRLLLTHHAPTRTDEELDAVAAAWTATPGGRPVTVAREGDRLPV
jgi:ribonuclease BN (tRNA processing enzyme)